MQPNVVVKINALDQTKEVFNRLKANVQDVAAEARIVKNRFEEMAPAFQKVALAGTAALTGIGLVARSAIKNASDLGESINAVNVVFGEGAETILSFGESAARSVGLAKGQFNQMATITGALLKDTGKPLTEVADLTNQLTVRAADMASVFNTDVSDAMSAINQAIRGETEAIRRYAGDVTDATLETYLLSKGIETNVADLTEQEKRLYRVELIMAQTAVTAGDFTNTSDSLANRQRILNAELANLSATFGQQLIPMIEQVTKVVGPYLAAAGQWINDNPKLAATIVVVGAALSGLAIVIAGIGLLIPPLIASFGLLAAAIGLISWPVLAIGAALAALVAAVYLLWQNWDQVTAWIKGALDGVGNAFWTTVNFIIGAFATLFDYMIPGWQGALSSFSNKWLSTWETAKTAFAAVWEAITGVFDIAAKSITSTMEALTKPIERVIDLAERAISLVGGVLRGTGAKISSTVQSIIDRGSSITGRATGGPVTRSTPYIVGERGPELFVPGSSGSIIPNGALQPAAAGMAPIYITITDNSFMGERDMAEKVGDQIIAIIKRNQRL